MQRGEVDIIGAAALGIIWTHPFTHAHSPEEIRRAHEKKIAAAALVCCAWLFIHRGDEQPAPVALSGTGTQLANVSVQGVGSLVSGMISAGTITAISTAWIPVIGAAVLGVTFLLSAIAKRAAQKTASTHVADEVEIQLKANLVAYNQGPRNVISQAAALANFDAAWAFVLSGNGCGAPALGDAGKRCISERQAGANPPWAVCKPNCPNWFTLYRDPIANDPHVTTTLTTDPTAALDSLFPSLTPAQLQSINWLLPAALIAVMVLL